MAKGANEVMARIDVGSALAIASATFGTTQAGATADYSDAHSVSPLLAKRVLAWSAAAQPVRDTGPRAGVTTTAARIGAVDMNEFGKGLTIAAGAA